MQSIDNTQDPIKKLSEAKLKSHIKSLYESNGASGTSPEIQKDIDLIMADPENLSFKLRSIYEVFKSNDELSNINFDSIAGDLYEAQETPIPTVETEVDEKKNPIPTQNTTVSDSNSVVENYSSESPLDREGPVINPGRLFSSVINNLDTSFISKDPEEAAEQLNKDLGNYGFSFSSDDGFLQVTSPDGQSERFRMYTPGYLDFPENPEKLENLKQLRVKQFQEYLLNASGGSKDYLVNGFANLSIEDFLPAVEGTLSTGYNKFKSDLVELKDKYYDIVDLNSFYSKGNVDPKSTINSLTNLRNKLSDKSYIPERIKGTEEGRAFEEGGRKEEISLINDLTNKVRESINENSSMMGAILSESGAYKFIDINDPIQLQVYGRMGLMPADIPTEAISVDGKASSLNRVYSIIHDWTKVNDIRSGKGHDIKIGEPKEAGLLAEDIVKLKEAMELQVAKKSDFADTKFGPIIRAIENQGHRLEGAFYNVGFSGLDFIKNLGVIVNEGLRTAGFSDQEADDITYGVTGSSLGIFSGFDPESINNLRQESIPYYEGDFVSDYEKSDSLLDYLSVTATRAYDEVSSNAINTGLFILNPFAGLMWMGINDLGEKLYDYRIGKESVRKKLASGEVLTLSDREVLNRTDLASRFYAAGNATKNVVVTRALTYPYLRNLKGALSGKAGAALKGQSSRFIRDFYNQYAKNQAASLRRRLIAQTGIHGRYLALENFEEGFISATDYFVDSYLGYTDFSMIEFNKRMVNTAASATINSFVIGVGLNKTNSKKAQKLGKEIVARQIMYPGEAELSIMKLDLSNRIAKFEVAAKANNVDLANINPYQALLDAASEVDDQIARVAKDKDELASMMSKADRVLFLEKLANIEGYNQTLTETTDGDVIKQTEKKRDEAKEDLRNILGKYPTKASFHYAPKEVRDKLSREAALRAGLQFDDDTEVGYANIKNNEEVLGKAEDLFVSRVKETEYNDVNLDFFGVDTHFGFLTPPRKVKVDPVSGVQVSGYVGYDIDFNVFEGDINEFNRVMDEFKIASGKATISDVLGETEADTQETLPSTELVSEKATEKSGIEELSADEVYSNRVLQIGNRIKEFGEVEFFSRLSNEDILNINQFIKDIGKGKRVPLGKIESIIDAQNIISDIKSRAGGKLTIQSEGDSKAYQDALGFHPFAYLRGKVLSNVATRDVLKKILFRDKNVGEPFFKIYDDLFAKYADVTNTASKIQDQHLKEYIKDAEADAKRTGEAATSLFVNPDSMFNSFESNILAALRRQVDVSEQISPLVGKEVMTLETPMGPKTEQEFLDPSGEFERAKNLVLEYGDLLRAQANQKNASATDVSRSQTWDQILNQLDVRNAKTFDDIASKASPRNLNLVEKMAALFDNQAAYDRINEFETHKPTKFVQGTYTPMFLLLENESYTDFAGPAVDPISSTLKEAVRPSSLDGGRIMLNPDLFFSNIYGQYKGTLADISMKKDLETFDSMVKSQAFKDLFTDSESVYGQQILNAFDNIKSEFLKDIKRVEPKKIDFEKETNIFKRGDFWKTIENAALGMLSAKSLVRVAQPANQFYTAAFSSFSYLDSNASKTYLAKRIAAYTLFSARKFDGNTAKVYEKDIASGITQTRTKLDNIYRMSRTGVRNSVFAETGLVQQKRMPMDYYFTQLGMDPAKFSDSVVKGLTYSFDEAIELINSSSEMSLDLFLANSDRLASNALFESAYIDYKTKKGEKIGDINEFWARENANPDKEAIRHADNIIVYMMRGTEQAAEANVYKADADTGVKFLMRSFFEYGRFINNSRSAIAAEIAILNDKNVPDDQKQEAKRRITSRVAEITTYNGMKFLTNSTFLFGGAWMLQTDEEDIERYGGMTQFVGEMTGMETRGDYDPSSMSLEDAESVEQYNAIRENTLRQMRGLRELNSVADDIGELSRTFENKFTISNPKSVIKQTAQDVIVQVSPTFIPQNVSDLLGAGFNELYGGDIYNEYISEDFFNIKTVDQGIRFAIDGLGMYGMGIEAATSYYRAYQLKNNFRIAKDPGEVGKERITYLTGQNDKIREKVIATANMIYDYRVAAMTSPAIRQDYDRIADKLERTLERYFTSTIKDDRLVELAQNPLTSKGVQVMADMPEKDYEPIRIIGPERAPEGYQPPQQSLEQPQQQIQQPQPNAISEDEVSVRPKKKFSHYKASVNFEKLQGKMELPIKGGTIVEGFGQKEDPNYGANVMTFNNGVTIASKRGSDVTSVLEGEVISVMENRQGILGVHVRHGNYNTMYYGLQDVKLKSGDTISKGETLGKLFGQADGKEELKFYIYQGEYRQNPEEWLAKPSKEPGRRVRVMATDDRR